MPTHIIQSRKELFQHVQNRTPSLPEIQPSTFDLPSYQQAVDRFLQDGRYRNLPPRTLAFYEYHLSGFQLFLLIKDEPFTAASFIPLVQLMVKELRDGGLAHMRGYLNLRGELRITDYGKMARITGVRVSPHTFRHTMAKMYIRNGGDPFSNKYWATHRSKWCIPTSGSLATKLESSTSVTVRWSI
ncbi:MAG TPA: hypothetical protein VMS09_12255 [Paenibacillus sp.]|uniref:hypothetical protein n=1 Tax=Paenibacillus sp. TaxID=58172 RepID=UPI0028D34C95|nr:hypothetical protein [Paenibacillus sp.]HUC92781.1 hypothetical protein [Paenibacillus sp.]